MLSRVFTRFLGVFALLFILLAQHPCFAFNAHAKRFSRIGIPHLTSDYLTQFESCSRWREGHRIKVFVAPGRESFEGIVCQGFNEWFRASRGAFNFTFVESAEQADFIINWSDRDTSVLDHTEAGVTLTDTTPDTVTNQEYIDRVECVIRTAIDGREISDSEIAATCLHEIGHGLGIDGHSSDKRDIMYYAVSSLQSGHTTQRDSQTIARLYH